MFDERFVDFLRDYIGTGDACDEKRVLGEVAGMLKLELVFEKVVGFCWREVDVVGVITSKGGEGICD